MKKIIIILSTLFLMVNYSMAQQTKAKKKEERNKKIAVLIKQEEEGIIAYKKHFAYGLNITTNGHGLYIEKGITSSIKRARLYQLEFSEIVSPKESKGYNNYPVSGIRSKYGKINNLYNIKLGVQEQLLIGNRTSKNGINITANAGGGIIFGLLKPYKLTLSQTAPRSDTVISYDTTTNQFLRTNLPLSGTSNIFNQWKGTKLTPGIYFRPAIRFDYGKFNEKMTSIEVGVEIAYYFNKPQLMALNKPQSLYFSGFIKIVTGKRK